jgi:uncharacterized protein YndB with AHSA1/START domain
MRDRELMTTRVFDAPREMVWEAWTDAEQVVKWWGPRGFTTTTHHMDVREGGDWRYIMHGPDGRDYKNRIVYMEVQKPERLVYKHSGEVDTEPVSFETTVTFVEENGKTRVTMRALFPSAADLQRVVREYGADEGAKQTFERLGEYLASEKSDSDELEFVIARTFAVPRELVWKAWTESTHMAKWWGPQGFTNPVCELDVRPGGTYRIVMRGDGVDFPLAGVYQEVVQPERLVMTVDTSGHPAEWQDMVDPNRGSNANPAGEILQTVTFDDVNGDTRLTIRMRFGLVAIRDAMVKMGMNEGWSQSLDRLTRLLGGMAS